MKAFLLAAGEGLRLRPLTTERPKALLPVLDRPQIAWALESVSRAGIREAIVNVHFHADPLAAAATALGRSLDIDVVISHEQDEPLGTAGALRHAAASINGRLVLLNCDLASDAPIGHLVAAHESARALATLLAVPSNVQADLIVENSWVTGLVDRREQQLGGLVYGGAAVLEPQIIELIPEGPSGLFETVLQPLVESNAAIAAFEWNGYWMDVGTPISYQIANLDALAGTRRFLPRMASDPKIFNGSIYVGANATVEGTSLRHTIVGSGATIEPGSRLERCIVWDGAHVRKSDYRDVVITRSHVVPIK